MAFDVGVNGNVSSWSSGDDAADILSNIGQYSFDASITADENDATEFSSSGVAALASIPGLKSISGTMRARFKPGGPLIGNGGLLTYSAGGYTAGVRQWSLSCSWTSNDSTAFNSTPPVWKSFVPGPLSWSYTAQGLIDSAAAIALPDDPGGSLATVTMKLSEEGATDNTIAGSAYTQASNVGPIEPNTLSAVNFNGRGSGDLTFAGGSNILTAGTLGIPSYDAADLVLKLTTGRTLSGVAFFTSLGITCDVAGAIDVSIGWQGTGVWALGT